MLYRLLCTSILVMTPATAFASGGFNATQYIGFVINFCILVGGVIFVTRKKMNLFFEERSASIAKEMEEAKRIHEEATELLKTYEARLASLNEETAKILTQFREDGEREKERILDESKEESARIRREAEFKVSQESKMARQRLLDDFAPAVVALAEEQIKGRLNAAAQEKYFSDGIDQLKNIRPEQVLVTAPAAADQP